MPERPFFSLRYTLPGYTFILMSILIALPRLLSLFSEIENIELVVVFLGFLLSGNPIGFLISQLWYVCFKSKSFRDGRLSWLRHILGGKGAKIQDDKIQFMKDKYKIGENKDYQILFHDFIHSTYSEKLKGYTQRRFDLIHIFGSTLVGIIISVLFGILIRLSLHSAGITLGNLCKSLSNLTIEEASQSLSSIFESITLYDVGVILVALTFSCLLILSLRNIYTEHALASELSVFTVWNERIFRPKDAKEVFPQKYFREERINSESEGKEQ